ncbi:MAG: D-glycero-beta-D-manno-heptose-7-phosphate kinase [Syntrophaceae bacterium]|nr:D-glycero-beta-D-manno-heptose-7-phosphate kinase [Syntrophaceae bacterium]
MEKTLKRPVSRRRALEIIGKYPAARVLVVGDLMVDHFIWGKVSRISPEAPVPVVEVTKENLMMGGSGNVVSNIHAMGGSVAVAGVIGSDAMGDWLKARLQQMDVDTGGLVQEGERPTTVKTRIVAHGQQMVRYDRESRYGVRPESADRIVRYVTSALDGLQAIVISDYNKGIVTDRLLDGIRRAVAGRPIPVCVDPKRNDFSVYRDFDVITPNHHEAGRAVGVENTHELNEGRRAEIARIGREILRRFGFRAVLITRGEAGMDLFERGGRDVHIPAEAREVFDVTGAGDTAIGVFALSLASGATFREAAYLANKAAGIVVGKIGTATVSPAELRRVV